MSEELNRRIAIEVMGEPEPPRPEPGDAIGVPTDHPWRPKVSAELLDGRLVYRWEPRNFSGNMDLAIRAVDKVLTHIVDEMISGYAVLSLDYWVDSGWLAEIEPENYKLRSEARGETAPEAICRCLLAFVNANGQ